MNIQTFSFANQSLQIIIKDNQAWFIASEVANLLGYLKASDLTRILDDDEKGTHNMRTLGGNQDVSIINESGFYHAAFKSRKAEVKPFRKWVTSEVLPQIRKTGTYSGSPKPTKDERTGLRQAVTMLVGKTDINHSAAYKLVHHRFGVASIEDLTHEQIPQAIEYVHRLILDKSLTGEILEKINQQTPNPPFDRAQLHDIIANMAVRLRDYGKLLTLFQRTPIADEKVCNHELCHLNKLYDDLMKLANDWQLKNTLGEPLFERNAINFYGGASIIW
ncbi:BRO-N domain-containing protein [Wielerella bovis]|uniref:BRO-N domain-containing protein n=1 Tax=Wielerella bovis TaxID=2917790 RepID=UPI0020190476|nr:BRO family protein [Wielerella bovis]MCG7657134.1 hypothetical protein [Wielerella bovis]MCG7659357.1 hypothetical protein [Wielerella bovis]